MPDLLALPRERVLLDGLRGFVKNDGEIKNASERWLDSYTETVQQLQQLQGDSRVGLIQRESVQKAATQTQVYRQSFKKLIEVTKAQNEATADLFATGDRATKTIQDLPNNVIDPAVRAAQQSQEADEIIK